MQSYLIFIIFLLPSRGKLYRLKADRKGTKDFEQKVFKKKANGYGNIQMLCRKVLADVFKFFITILIS